MQFSFLTPVYFKVICLFVLFGVLIPFYSFVKCFFFSLFMDFGLVTICFRLQPNWALARVG